MSNDYFRNLIQQNGKITQEYTKENTMAIANNGSNSQDLLADKKEQIMINTRESVQRFFGSQFEEKKEEVKQYIEEYLSTKEQITDLIVLKKYTQDVYDSMVGYGPLESLLHDPNVTEIMVTRYDKVYVEKNGVMQLLPDVYFNSEKHLQNVIQKIVMQKGKKIDDSEPLCDTSLPDGSRVNATFPAISPEGSTLTIRKFSNKNISYDDYINLGSISVQMIEFLKLAVKGKANIFITGGTGTGKTTFLNMLSSFIPSTEAIVTIEDTLELKLQQENVRKMLTRGEVNGVGGITTRDLVKNALRQRPDRIVVGEVRDGSIYDLLDSWGSGHEGGMGTAHSKSPSHLVNNRIETLMGMSDINMAEESQKNMIADAIDLVVFIKRFTDGSRKITAITEILGYGEDSGIKDAKDKIYLKDIYKFKNQGFENGKIIGTYEATGHIPKRVINKAEIYNVHFDEDLFKKV